MTVLLGVCDGLCLHNIYIKNNNCLSEIGKSLLLYGEEQWHVLFQSSSAADLTSLDSPSHLEAGKQGVRQTGRPY